jgi:Ni/Fe-hydrogenase b-type cytochrome subunit
MTARSSLIHPGVVRFTHWLNAIVLVVMVASGLEIFAAFPSFGEKIPHHNLVAIPGVVRLGGWLGGALQWHFAFAWLFAGGGIAYISYQFLSGRWRQTAFLPVDIRGVWPMARHYLGLGPLPPFAGEYNPLQKLAYATTVACSAVAVITGLALYKPVQLGPIVALVGGFGLVRVGHFLAMCGLLAFIPGHLIMVALHGWDNFQSMLSGRRLTKRLMLPDEESHHKGE